MARRLHSGHIGTGHHGKVRDRRPKLWVAAIGKLASDRTDPPVIAPSVGQATFLSDHQADLILDNQRRRHLIPAECEDAVAP